MQDDIARQPSQTERKPPGESEQKPERHQHEAQQDQHAAERRHASSMARPGPRGSYCTEDWRRRSNRPAQPTSRMASTAMLVSEAAGTPGGVTGPSGMCAQAGIVAGCRELPG